MSKFISSIALRFASCVEFLDEMNDQTIKLQRAHAADIETQMRLNARRISRALEHDYSERTLSQGQATRAAKRSHELARIERNKQRSMSRSAKHALLDA